MERWRVIEAVRLLPSNCRVGEKTFAILVLENANRPASSKPAVPTGTWTWTAVCHRGSGYIQVGVRRFVSRTVIDVEHPLVHAEITLLQGNGFFIAIRVADQAEAPSRTSVGTPGTLESGGWRYGSSVGGVLTGIRLCVTDKSILGGECPVTRDDIGGGISAARHHGQTTVLDVSQHTVEVQIPLVPKPNRREVRLGPTVL